MKEHQYLLLKNKTSTCLITFVSTKVEADISSKSWS